MGAQHTFSPSTPPDVHYPGSQPQQAVGGPASGLPDVPGEDGRPNGTLDQTHSRYVGYRDVEFLSGIPQIQLSRSQNRDQPATNSYVGTDNGRETNANQRRYDDRRILAVDRPVDHLEHK